MTRVFIGGSLSITRLAVEVRHRLDRIVMTFSQESALSTCAPMASFQLCSANSIARLRGGSRPMPPLKGWDRASLTRRR